MKQDKSVTTPNPPPSVLPYEPRRTSTLLFLVAISMLLLGALGGYYLGTNRSSIPPTSRPQTACTLDAKVCSDGSSVGRVPPACEFAPCPNTQSTPDPTANWKTYTNQPSGYSFKYPPEWNVFPRPTDVQLNPDVYVQKYNHNVVNVLSVNSYKDVAEKNSRRGTDALPQKSVWEQNLPFKTISVDGKNAKLNTQNLGTQWEFNILISYEKGFVELTWTDSMDQGEQKTFDLILSTFRFLK